MHALIVLFLATHRGRRLDRGQSTAEYALVVLGAAAVAFIFITWAGGTDTITRLFDSVMDSVIGRIT